MNPLTTQNSFSYRLTLGLASYFRTSFAGKIKWVLGGALNKPMDYFDFVFMDCPLFCSFAGFNAKKNLDLTLTPKAKNTGIGSDNN